MSTNFLRVFNFGLGFLAVGVTSTSVTLTLQEGDLANFPAPGPSADRYRIVMGREVMEVTGRDASANTLTVIRGQEGTTAISHLALAVISIRLTAAGVLSMQDAINELEASLGTIQIRVDDGMDVGDRPRLNFIGGVGITLSAVDDPTNNEVAITIQGGAGAGTGTMTTVEEEGVQVGDADIIVLNFGAGFDITEAPNAQINIALDLSEVGGSEGAALLGAVIVAGGF